MEELPVSLTRGDTPPPLSLRMGLLMLPVLALRMSGCTKGDDPADGVGSGPLDATAAS